MSSKSPSSPSSSATLQVALIFPLVAMTCWGTYGPLLGRATGLLGDSTGLALSLIGLGYFLVGVVGGMILLKSGIVPDNGEWNRDGWGKGLFAGVLGACGNLALIIALQLYHRPEVVMPLLFGGVQLGNTVFTCLELKSLPKRGFAVGVVLLIIGVVTTLSYRPAEQHAEEAINWWFLPAVAVVWVCWGKYGVQVHRAIDGFKKSGIRAMVALSTAYVVVGLGAFGWAFGADSDVAYTGDGFRLGLLAGVITTIGAWGIAFGNRYVKGGPSVVMPLVFAGAPVVNSFFVMQTGGFSWSEVDPRFWLGIAVIIVGGYLVLTNKPDAPAPAAAPQPA